MTIDQTLAERGSRYGEFPEHAFLTQELKNAMHDHDGWHELDDDMKECLDMIAHKIGRIINGDPTYIDSWTDIIGYTRLVEKRLITEQQAPDDMASAILGKFKKPGETATPHAVAEALRLLVDAGVLVEVEEEDGDS